MKYQKQLDRLNSGTMSRHELAVMKKNAKALVEKGDSDAVAILNAIDYSKPADDYILFMGFCPGVLAPLSSVSPLLHALHASARLQSPPRTRTVV